MRSALLAPLLLYLTLPLLPSCSVGLDTEALSSQFGAGSSAIAGSAAAGSSGYQGGSGGNSNASGGAGTSGSSGASGNAGTATAGTGACTSGAAEACDGIDNDCDPSTPDECAEGCSGVAWRGRGYMQCTQISSYAQAEAACESSGMHLIKIESAAEDEFVLSLVKELDEWVWIGAAEPGTSGNFAWYDGSLMFEDGQVVPGTYGNFAPDQPGPIAGRACIQTTRGPQLPPGTWSATSCTDTEPYICEAE